MGKIYKPQLRCDAASRLVRQVVREQLDLKEFQVQVREGGRRGMTVTVFDPDKDPDGSCATLLVTLLGQLFAPAQASGRMADMLV